MNSRAMSAEGTPGAEPPYLSESDLLRRAHAFASAVHAGQRGKDGSPYIVHPLAVAEIVRESGLPDEVVAAALLHDAVEDSSVSVAEVRERFGDEVASLVAAMTEDSGIADYERRKQALRDQVEAAGPDAAAIYAADKLSNVRTVRGVQERDAGKVESLFRAPLDTRVELWRGDADMVARVAPRLGYLDDLRSEVEGFDESRRRGRVGAAAER